jgi:hypothetical protein
MLDYIFLIPIGSTINGKLLEQYLKLRSWCDKNNADILITNGKMHNFARNYLATGGKGFENPGPPDAKWLIWLDSDIQFTIEQIETLIKIEHPFVSGWYVSDLGNQVMAGRWDIEFFKKHKFMPFFDKNKLLELAKDKPNDYLEADFVGFGFVKIHRNIIEKMTYPYFTLNIQEIDNFKDLSYEDCSFCQNCFKETGIKPIIVPNLHVGHLKSIHLY